MAELPIKVVEYCEAQAWDEDSRQDFYLRWLEADDMEIPEFVDEQHLHGYCNAVYANMQRNTRAKELNRKSLEIAHADKIREVFGWTGHVMDVEELMILREEVKDKLKELSTLLRRTLEEVIIHGTSPEELAKAEGTDVNAIYKRIHDAKKKLEEL